jgi:hypothetical protein
MILIIALFWYFVNINTKIINHEGREGHRGECKSKRAGAEGQRHTGTKWWRRLPYYFALNGFAGQGQRAKGTQAQSGGGAYYFAILLRILLRQGYEETSYGGQGYEVQVAGCFVF